MSSGVPSPAEPSPEVSRPNPARMYDAVIGGNHNFRADREAVAQMLPSVLVAARGVPVVPRDRARLMALLAGTDLVEPGLVWIPRWRPDQDHAEPVDPDTVEGYAAVGRVRR